MKFKARKNPAIEVCLTHMTIAEFLQQRTSKNMEPKGSEFACLGERILDAVQGAKKTYDRSVHKGT